MTGCNHDAAGMLALAHSKGERRRRCNRTGQEHRNPGSTQDLRHDPCKRARSKTGVIGNGNTGGWIFLLEHIVCDRGGGNPHIRKGEVIRDDPAPAIRAKFDCRLACRVAHALLPLEKVCVAGLTSGDGGRRRPGRGSACRHPAIARGLSPAARLPYPPQPGPRHPAG